MAVTCDWLCAVLPLGSNWWHRPIRQHEWSARSVRQHGRWSDGRCSAWHSYHTTSDGWCETTSSSVLDTAVATRTTTTRTTTTRATSGSCRSLSASRPASLHRTRAYQTRWVSLLRLWHIQSYNMVTSWQGTLPASLARCGLVTTGFPQTTASNGGLRCFRCC